MWFKSKRLTPEPSTARIMAAAIKVGVYIYTIPPPARHHDISIMMYREGVLPLLSLIAEQGFITYHGTFLSRKAAFIIARAAGQILQDSEIINAELYSENLW